MEKLKNTIQSLKQKTGQRMIKIGENLQNLGANLAGKKVPIALNDFTNMQSDQDEQTLATENIVVAPVIDATLYPDFNVRNGFLTYKDMYVLYPLNPSLLTKQPYQRYDLGRIAAKADVKTKKIQCDKVLLAEHCYDEKTFVNRIDYIMNNLPVKYLENTIKEDECLNMNGEREI